MSAASPPSAIAPAASGATPAATPNTAATVEALRALARASRLLERASGEVNLAHYRVLAAIASGDQRASRIASKLALGKPTISASVEWLCQRGFLARSEVQGDQRAATLLLTAEGEKLLASTETSMATWLDQICSHTPDSAQVLNALVWMGRAIEQVAAERHAEGR